MSLAIKHKIPPSMLFLIWTIRSKAAALGFRIFTLLTKAVKWRQSSLGRRRCLCLLLASSTVPPRRSKITPQTPIHLALQNERNVLVSSLAANKRRDFDPHAFLATIGEGRKSVFFQRKQGIFAQGDTADAVFYIQTGKVKLTMVSKTVKEATIGILGDGDFFGEGSLVGHAPAMTDCPVLQIDKKAMMEALHRKREFFDLFVAYLLARNIRYEEDLVDQLFNSSEKRLARILLLLAQFGKEGKPETVVPKISHDGRQLEFPAGDN